MLFAVVCLYVSDRVATQWLWSLATRRARSVSRLNSSARWVWLPNSRNADGALPSKHNNNNNNLNADNSACRCDARRKLSSRRSRSRRRRPETPSTSSSNPHRSAKNDSLVVFFCLLLVHVDHSMRCWTTAVLVLFVVTVSRFYECFVVFNRCCCYSVSSSSASGRTNSEA